MQLKHWFPSTALWLAATLPATIAQDLSSPFDADAQGWSVDREEAAVVWTEFGGFPGGFIQASATVNEPWYFVSPASWAGDWRRFGIIKFDLRIINRSYADEDLNDILIIHGVNGVDLVWRGPSPLWQWNHYEVVLRPSYFGVDQATFDGVMQDVESARILGKYTGVANEPVGLDNALLTEQTSPAPDELISTFDTDIEEWRPYDDVTLTWQPDDANGGGYLYGDDWADGRVYHFTSPIAWAGDWRQFRMLRFDLIKLTGGSAGGDEAAIVKIVGANGATIEWIGPGPDADWTPYRIYLVAENFGLDDAAFEAVMAHVVEVRILGEYVSGDEAEGLDNVILTKQGPPVFTENLISSFDTDLDDWRGGGDVNPSWVETGGNPGGYLRGVNDGGGVWHFATPESWSGDWTQYRSLQFDHVILSGANSMWTDDTFYIEGANGSTLGWKGPEPTDVWTHFAVDLSPATFDVTPEEYDAVMSNVVELRVRGEYVNGPDSEGLDNVFLSKSPLQGEGPLAPHVGIVRVTDASIEIRVVTEVGVHYQLQTTTDLIEGPWIDAEGGGLIGNGALSVLEIANVDTGLPGLFFRIKASKTGSE